jgi:hypothetical protein
VVVSVGIQHNVYRLAHLASTVAVLAGYHKCSSGCLIVLAVSELGVLYCGNCVC